MKLDSSNPEESSASINTFDVYREHFPILAKHIRGKPSVFLDSAASAQKPEVVINKIKSFYETEYANIHRGVYWLSERSTAAYESSRVKVAKFIGASSENEIVFTKSATEAINLVANSWGGKHLSEGDEVLITTLEHHANIIPWHLLRETKGIIIKAVRLDENGCLDLEHFYELLNEKTKLVGVTQTSNALGITTPLNKIIKSAHEIGAKVLVDGCQGVVHSPVNVQKLDADFYVFSGHKLYGPSGIGVLYGKSELLSSMPPYQGGGDMIVTVSMEESTYADPPMRFEAGTPNIAGAIGLGTAIDYVSSIGMEKIKEHENKVTKYANFKLKELDFLDIYAEEVEKAGIISFNVKDIHPHDVGTILDQKGVAVRVGHHCAQPLMQHLGISGTVRMSLGLYNSEKDIDALVSSLESVMEVFS